MSASRLRDRAIEETILGERSAAGRVGGDDRWPPQPANTSGPYRWR
jgi:hypothetical protein